MDLINVTGPIAAGATTLSSRLTQENNWIPVLEPNVESENPFFSLYHATPKRYAFHNQIHFLVASSKTHLTLRQLSRPEDVYVQDYTPFEHVEVYAWVQHEFGLLSKEEYKTLIELNHVLEEGFILPRVLIYRPLTQGLLLKRIQDRGRPSEQSINYEFLDAIRQRFEEWLKAWDKTPVIRTDENLDVLKDQEAISNLSQSVIQNLTISESKAVYQK